MVERFPVFLASGVEGATLGAGAEVEQMQGKNPEPSCEQACVPGAPPTQGHSTTRPGSHTRAGASEQAPRSTTKTRIRRLILRGYLRETRAAYLD